MATAKRRTETRVEETAAGPGGPLHALQDYLPNRRTALGAARAAAWTLAALAVYWLAYAFVSESAPFRVDPERDGLRLEGLAVLRSDEVSQIFAEDFGRSLKDVDLDRRLRQLRSVPWVRDARVGRVWPNTITVSVEEREPIAFVRLPGVNETRLIDAHGVILDSRREGGRSLPVLTGVAEAMPLEERRARIELFQSVMRTFADRQDGLGEAVSEMDVSDAANAVVLAKYENEMIKLQMGDRHLNHRLNVFLSHIDAWRAEFGPVESVDLRFEKQVAVQPATTGG